MITFLRQCGYGKTTLPNIISCMDLGTNITSSKEISKEKSQLLNTVIRWGCRSPLPNTPNLVINPGLQIKKISDKRSSRLFLSEKGLAPKSFPSVSSFYEAAKNGFDPEGVILRPGFHSGGKNLHFCKDIYDIEKAAQKYHPHFYISEYIPKVSEFRVMIVGGAIVWVAEKVPSDKSEIAWNHNQGSPFVNVKWGSWDLEMVSTSLKAFKQFQLDFAAVDIMVDSNGKSFVLELNSAPTSSSEYRCACIGKALQFHVDQTKLMNTKYIHPISNIQSWKDLIHPSIWKD